MMKHLLSFEVLTEFLGHVPSYKGSSHAFQKNHSVVSVCVPFRSSKQLTDFYEIRYERYDTGGRSSFYRVTRKIVGENGHWIHNKGTCKNIQH